MSKVVVTGAPGGQTINHCGVRIVPGVMITVSEKDAEVYGKNVVIVKRLVEDFSPPKPERKPEPEQVLTPMSPQQLAERAQGVGDGGRIERGGQKRGK